MAAEQQKGQASCLPSLPQPASKGPTHYVDKENIDPFLDQHKATGPGLYGVPPTKQQFGAKLAGNTRKPLQDITALILAQQEGGLPPKQQQQAGAGAQKGLWGSHQVQDKLAQAAAGGASTSGRRLSAMR